MLIRLTRLTPTFTGSFKSLSGFLGNIQHYNESEIFINSDSIKVMECFGCVTTLYLDDALKTPIHVKETPERIMTIMKHTLNQQN